MSGATQLAEFYREVSQLWQLYVSRGPGNVEPQALENVVVAYEVIMRQPDSLTSVQQDAVDVLYRLSRRCVESPAGLSFVTGEAGLIPNPSLHRDFENALYCLRDAVSQ